MNFEKIFTNASLECFGRKDTEYTFNNKNEYNYYHELISSIISGRKYFVYNDNAYHSSSIYFITDKIKIKEKNLILPDNLTYSSKDRSNLYGIPLYYKYSDNSLMMIVFIKSKEEFHKSKTGYSNTIIIPKEIYDEYEIDSSYHNHARFNNYKKLVEYNSNSNIKITFNKKITFENNEESNVFEIEGTSFEIANCTTKIIYKCNEIEIIDNFSSFIISPTKNSLIKLNEKEDTNSKLIVLSNNARNQSIYQNNLNLPDNTRKQIMWKQDLAASLYTIEIFKYHEYDIAGYFKITDEEYLLFTKNVSSNQCYYIFDLLYNSGGYKYKIKAYDKLGKCITTIYPYENTFEDKKNTIRWEQVEDTDFYSIECFYPLIFNAELLTNFKLKQHNKDCYIVDNYKTITTENYHLMIKENTNSNTCIYNINLTKGKYLYLVKAYDKENNLIKSYKTLIEIIE